MFKVRFYFGYKHGPSYSGTPVGRSPCVPLSGSHTRAPIGRTALRACRTGPYPKVSPLDDSPSPRAAHIDRTHAHGRTRANVPWDRRDTHGTAYHGTARKRAHRRCLPAGPPCGMRMHAHADGWAPRPASQNLTCMSHPHHSFRLNDFHIAETWMCRLTRLHGDTVKRIIS